MGHYREILPKMVSISNNSQLTKEMSAILSEKLSPEELHKFREWIKLVDLNTQTQKNQIKRFGHF